MSRQSIYVRVHNGWAMGLGPIYVRVHNDPARPPGNPWGSHSQQHSRRPVTPAFAISGCLNLGAPRADEPLDQEEMR